ncbi:MAG: DNA-directed DNA polymerase I [Desulfurococcales archaeon]|jgi:DNA polymerase I|nr:DNA-directed DNA polymerase I [Desulfurococcales archaeon]
MVDKADLRKNTRSLFQFSRHVNSLKKDISSGDKYHTKDPSIDAEDAANKSNKYRASRQHSSERGAIGGLDRYLGQRLSRTQHSPTQSLMNDVEASNNEVTDENALKTEAGSQGGITGESMYEGGRFVYHKGSPDVDSLDASIFDIPEAIEVEGYVMEVQYDGKVSKAVLYIYVEEEGRLYRVYDKTGHRPYFLVDLDPDKVRGIVGNSDDVVDIYRVEKFDLLLNRKIMLTKIVVKDPLAVRRLRDRFPKAWEANIKYHHNYIYDTQLIPGLRYRIRNGRFDPVIDIDGDKISIEINKTFADETEDVKEIAVKWYPLFEAPPPRIKRLSIDIEVYTPNKGRVPNPETAEYPIVSIAMCSNDGACSVFILRRGDEKAVERLKEVVDSRTRVYVFESERELVKRFFQEISRYPVIITFNGDNFDLPYLYTRSRKLGFSREEIPVVIKETHTSFRHALHIDLYRFFKNRAIQNYAFEGRYKEYTLDSVAQALLGKGKLANEEGIGSMSLYDLARYNLRDAQLTIELTTFSNELLWKLIILLMRISKLGIEDVTRTQVSTWIKNLFYWEHRSKGYLIPTEADLASLKSRKATEAIIKGKKYAGAIVIDPPQGVFFDVVVADYASLYPSIIKRWNLSYETVDPPEGECNRLEPIRDETGATIHSVCMDRVGITSVIIGLLRDFRVKIYKKKAKEKNIQEDMRNWYDVVQRAMKVYINASYGVFGHEKFPLYALPVAESVTALGRMIITMSQQKARELGLMVLYGDTDSLFIWAPQEDRLNQLRKWILDSFGLELDIDKKYRFAAFSLKKNYLGVYPEGSVDIKGLVGKKKHIPEFVKEAFSEAVKKLGSIDTPQDLLMVSTWLKEILQEIYRKLKDKEYTLDQLSFKMTLGKPLETYTKNTPQHVKAALMLVREGIKISQGDNIWFVKVKSKEGVKPVQLAKISEIDVEKYIESLRSAFEQILAPLSIEWEEISGHSKIFDTK